jgi:hypothetical protein
MDVWALEGDALVLANFICQLDALQSMSTMDFVGIVASNFPFVS